MKKLTQIYFFTLVILFCTKSSYSQNTNIKLNENSIVINDSVIFKEGKFKYSCLKKVQEILKTKNKECRTLKGVNTSYFFEDLGLEFIYVWHNKCNLIDLNILYTTECPYCNSLYKGYKKFAAYKGTLNLLGIDVTNQTTVKDIIKSSFFSNGLSQESFLKKNYIEYSNKELNYAILFDGNSQNAKIVSVAIEIYRNPN